MVNFGPLTAEIRSGVWGTPANFNGFRVLAALLHGTLVDYVTLGLVDHMKQLTLGLVGRGLRAADRNRAA